MIPHASETHFDSLHEALRMGKNSLTHVTIADYTT